MSEVGSAAIRWASEVEQALSGCGNNYVADAVSVVCARNLGDGPDWDLGLFRVERRAQAELVHDIFGNPFRPATIDPKWLAWNDGTVPKLAQTIYDDRRFDLLPILADALEEAGCDDAGILAHCRGTGPHARGCWVVDLILGKM